MLEICLTNRAGMIQEKALEHAFAIPGKRRLFTAHTLSGLE
jgi:hypothetical protein